MGTVARGSGWLAAASWCAQHAGVSAVAAALALAGAWWAVRAVRGAGLRRVLIGFGAAVSLVITVIAAARSFDAVRVRFGSPMVPMTTDGAIAAFTALRLGALSRGWRLPGITAATYFYIGVTVALNVQAARGADGRFAAAVAPVTFSVLMEYLAHLLRLHLRYATSAEARVTLLVWLVSPVVVTRGWLHMVRTGSGDPVAARVLVQQSMAVRARLAVVCPNRRWYAVFGSAARARRATLAALRDQALTPLQVINLLPEAGTLAPVDLLARVADAAIRDGARPAVPRPRRESRASAGEAGSPGRGPSGGRGGESGGAGESGPAADSGRAGGRGAHAQDRESEAPAAQQLADRERPDAVDRLGPIEREALEEICARVGPTPGQPTLLAEFRSRGLPLGSTNAAALARALKQRPLSSLSRPGQGEAARGAVR